MLLCSKLPWWHRFSAPRWQKHRSRGISPGMHGSSRGCRANGHRPRGAAALLPPLSNARIHPHSSPAPGRRPREPAPRGSQLKQETGKTQAPAGACRVPSKPPASERQGRAAKFPAPRPDPPPGAQGGKTLQKKKKKSHSSFSLCLFSALR